MRCEECLDEFGEKREMTPDEWVPFVAVCPLGHMEYV